MKGINIKNHEHKLGQYVDDAFMFLDGSSKTLRITLDILDKFYYCSGLKANLDKTQAVWLGRKPKKMISGLKFDLTWVEEFRLLGINFTKEMSNMAELNYNPKIQSMLLLFQEHQKRNLTLIGEITVVKSLAIPNLVHAMMVLQHPGEKY